MLTYDDARKHAADMVKVTAKRYMPPWLPEPGYGEFAEPRLLSTQQIDTLRRWADGGMPEGEPTALPPIPQWTEGWQLGRPDLVVTMPVAFTLPADGPDVYRNFTIPVPLDRARYVRAVEFQPGNPRIVHHAFLRFDKTSQSRKLDEQDQEPGFSGMHTPSSALSPDSQFLSWQPGKVPSPAPPGLSWPLGRGTELVLQLHLKPAGKPEQIQAAVGFYFTDQAPSRIPYKIRLTSFDIDIPVGATNHLVKDAFTLPVDVEVLGVLPHAHLLGRRLHGFATLPDGARRELLLIQEWDFNWQGDYRYAAPVALPKGTTLAMAFSYDNSTGNPRNPNHPPRRVRYGLGSADEMAELWLLVVLKNTQDLDLLAEHEKARVAREAVAYNSYLLRLNPQNAKAHADIGKALILVGRDREGEAHLREALGIQPDFDEAHYWLGIYFRRRDNAPAAIKEFEAVVRANPDHAKAHGNLGLIFLEQGLLDRAEGYFRAALRLDPEDEIAKESLAEIAQRKGGAKQK